MSKRNYNVFFNTHTISGIVISVGLFIIFFAGSFSFFREEIQIWEEGKSIHNRNFTSIDFDKLTKHLDKEYDLYARDVSYRVNTPNKLTIDLSASKDSLAKGGIKASEYFILNTKDYTKQTYSENYGLGEFLYRLHFLDPFVYPIGRYLAGFIAIFFVFAIVTGTIVHWKKIIPNFYNFNPKIVLKRVWTDAHTALGILGLPFQFIYGITGAFFIIKILVLIPISFLYQGNQKKMYDDLLPELKVQEWVASSTNTPNNVNTFIKNKTAYWEDFTIDEFKIINYGGNNMQYEIGGKTDPKKRFVGLGIAKFDAYSGDLVSQKNPYEVTYVQDALQVTYNLHFGDFGGMSLRIIYFVFGLLTCFVIITGVLIWIEARNKKSMTLKQRLYTAKVGHIYLAICLSMLPVTALAFLFTRITHGQFEDSKSAMYWFYFITWALFIIFYRFKRDNYFTNKNSLLLGAIFGFMVTIVNGITSGNWLWKSIANHQYEIATIDLFWIIVSTEVLIIYLKIKPKEQMQSAFVKNPIDYKNIKQQLREEKKELNPSIKTTKKSKKDINFIPMRTKIITLWSLIIFGSIFHYLYGVMAIVYFKETLPIEIKEVGTPQFAHIFRLLMEGSALLFILLTLVLKSKAFKLVSFFWSIIMSLFNCYHVIEELMHDASNISLLFILLLTAVASVLLTIHLWKWIKNPAKLN